MAPFPDVLPLAEVPLFVDYLLREFGEPASLRDVPPRLSTEISSTVPPMEWEISTWAPGSWEVRMARPITPSTEPRLHVKAPGGWSLRCTGARLGLTRFRIDADSDTWTRIEELIHKFWAPDLEWLWPPTVPKKWRKFSSRKPTVSVVRHAHVVPGAEVLLTGLAPQQFCFALTVSGEDQTLLPVTFLGPIGLRASGSSERWICELRPGAPLPRLADVYPGAEAHPYEPLPDAPKRDRLLGESDLHGLLFARRGGPGRELYEVHRSLEDLVRECRFALGPSEHVSALVPEDPTAWIVEWALNGNSSVFGRSLPPEPGQLRTYELMLHGLSEAAASSWQSRLDSAGLTVRERQRIGAR
jgi:hypothetical protein